MGRDSIYCLYNSMPENFLLLLLYRVQNIFMSWKKILRISSFFTPICYLFNKHLNYFD